MIVFPPEFVKTRYPGYFWDTKRQQLYSIKIDGLLKPLTLRKKFCQKLNGSLILSDIPNYRISVNGKRRYLFLMELKNIKQPTEDQTIDIKQER